MITIHTIITFIAQKNDAIDDVQAVS